MQHRLEYGIYVKAARGRLARKFHTLNLRLRLRLHLHRVIVVGVLFCWTTIL
jgi:hypothetical protein